MNIITIDFETYYDKDFSLSKITTEEYVRDDRFEVIGIAVKENDNETRWITGSHDEVASALASYDWGNSFVLAHNAMFDASILTWRFGIKPMAWLDTLSMARAVHGSEVGGSLAKLVDHYGLGEKGTEVVNALGKRRAHFDDGALRAYAGYCINDVELTYGLFLELVKNFKQVELKLIDITIRMFSDPALVLDTPLLEAHLEDVKTRKERLLEAVNQDREALMSNQKFADLLIKCGVVPPMKVSPTTGKDPLALAKSDEELADLKRKVDICFKVKRPKLVAALNAIIDDAIANNKTLREDSVKLYKGIQ